MNIRLTVPNVDVGLLRKQRDAVNNLAHGEDVLPGEYFDELVGLTNLLDAMLDIADTHDWVRPLVGSDANKWRFRCVKCGAAHDVPTTLTERYAKLTCPTRGCTP